MLLYTANREYDSGWQFSPCLVLFSRFKTTPKDTAAAVCGGWEMSEEEHARGKGIA